MKISQGASEGIATQEVPFSVANILLGLEELFLQ